MTENVGIIRNREKLLAAQKQVDKYNKLLSNMKIKTIEDIELRNMVLIADCIIKSALEREESRGAHYREDFPNTDNDNWKRNILRWITE